MGHFKGATMAATHSGAIARNAALLASIFGSRQAREEAFLRAEAARAYASPLSAELWEGVAAAIGRDGYQDVDPF